MTEPCLLPVLGAVTLTAAVSWAFGFLTGFVA